MKKIAISYEYDAKNIQIKQLIWPQQCPCCGDKTNGNFYNHECRIDLSKLVPQQVSYISSNRFYSLHWRAPYCKTCVDHTRKEEKLRISVIFIDFLFFVIGVLYLAQTNRILWFPLLMIALFLSDSFFLKVVLPKLLKPSLNKTCKIQERAIRVKSRKNHILMYFNDNEYARNFAQLNNLSLE